jgi:hypothetical protein
LAPFSVFLSRSIGLAKFFLYINNNFNTIGEGGCAMTEVGNDRVTVTHANRGVSTDSPKKSFLSRVYSNITGVFGNTKVLACADKVAMCCQNVLKLTKNKQAADYVKSLRIFDWFLLSKQAVEKDGPFPQPMERDFFKGLKQSVDSTNSIEMLVWAPLSLMKEYGLSGLEKIASSVGGVSESAVKLLAAALESKSFENLEQQLNVLDTFQKVLSVCIAARKNVKSLEFVVKSLDLARVSAKALGQEEISLYLGVVVGALSSIAIWKSK